MTNRRLAIVDFGLAPVLPTPGSEFAREGEGHIDIVLLPQRAPSGHSPESPIP